MSSVVLRRNDRAGTTEAAKLNLPTSDSNFFRDIRCFCRVSPTTALYWKKFINWQFCPLIQCPIRCLKRWYLLQVLLFFWCHGYTEIFTYIQESLEMFVTFFLSVCHDEKIVYHMDTFDVRNFKLESCLDGRRKTFEYSTRRGTTLW